MFSSDSILHISPLTHTQANFLVTYLQNPFSDFYIEQVVLTIDKPIDTLQLQNAYQKTVQELDILRTVFVFEQVERPLQVVLKEINPKIQFFPIEQLSPQSLNAEEIIQKERQTPFDLSSETAYRLVVIQDKSQTYLAFTYHHILMDGWSVELFFEILSQNYQNLPRASTSPPFKIFCQWYEVVSQNEASRIFWQNFLASTETATSIEIWKENTYFLPYQQQIQDFEWEIKPLQGFCMQYGLSLPTVLQSIWAILLGYYTGKSTVYYGLVSSGRPTEFPEFHQIVGVLIQTLPIRVNLDKQVSFLQLAQDIQKTMFQVLENQFYPLNEIKKITTVEGELFDHVLAFENFAKDLSFFPILQKQVHTKTHYPLNLIFLIETENLILRFNYNSSYFHRDSIHQIHQNWQNITKQILQNPAILLDGLQPLSKDTLHHLWTHLNPPPSTFPHTNLIKIWNEQVVHFPDKIALITEKNSFTYQELEFLSSKVATFLQNKFQKNLLGKAIGIHLNRSEKLIAAILGILKVGAYYVPMDKSFPEERVAFICEDAQLEILIEDHFFEQLSFLDEVSISLDWGNFEAQTPAYIIYTSGTTGKPKGCIISHLNVVRLLFNAHFPFDFSSEDVWIMAHSPAFDFSVWEIFGALLRGATLVVPDAQSVRDTQRFRAILIQNRVTVLNQTPSAFYNLIAIDSIASDRIPTLRYVIFGGDKLQPHLLQNWVSRYPLHQTQLVNMYGITETTVHVTHHTLSDKDIQNQIVSPIGKPLPETQVYILNENLEPLPLGAWGEIFVGGTGVALGYWKRVELTQERFVLLKDDVQGKTIRLYKSGDMGRWNHQGDLEYGRRKDNQVKIRGYRIELSEIEYHLKKYPAIQDVWVLAKEIQGQTSLVAYYVAHSAVKTYELLEYLQRILPAYMMPHYWVFMDKIPLTHNGKIDFQAFPLPNMLQKKQPEKPTFQTPQQLLLAEIWQKVLAVSMIGVEDNFFHQGGDSIKAIQIISQVQRFGYQLQIKDIFESPTIVTLAEKLIPIQEKAETADTTSDIFLSNAFVEEILIQKKSPFQLQKAFALSFLQEGILYECLKNPNSEAYSTQITYEVTTHFTQEDFLKSFEKLLNRHEALRTLFVFEELESPIQMVVHHFPPDFRFFDLVHLPLKEKEEWLQTYKKADMLQGFQLELQPLIRLSVVKLDDKLYQMIWTHHHLLLDGWSWGIVMQDFWKWMTNLSMKPAFPYFPFVDWLQKQARAKTLDFWKNYLKDFENPTLIPQHAKPSDTQFQTFVRAISFVSIESLQDFLSNAQISLHTLLQTIWGIVLQRLNHTEDVVLGTVFNGRPTEILNIDEAVGLFIQTVPVRFHYEAETPILSILHQQQKDFWEITSFAYCPLSEIQQTSSVSSQLLSHLLIVENYPLATIEHLSHPDFKILSIDSYEPTHYDFNLVIYPRNEKIELKFLYNEYAHSLNQIQQIAAYFERILYQILQNPLVTLTEICLLSQTEKSILLHFSGLSAYQRFQANSFVSIFDLFKNQVIAKPTFTALEDGDLIWDYQTLFNNVHHLASILYRDFEVQKGDVIGVSVERNTKMVLAFWAVLRLGAVYTPIDPYYPYERIAYIVNDCAPKVILTESIFVHLFEQLPFYLMDDAPSNFSKLTEVSDITIQTQPFDPSFLIYTSGSTGTPKGVLQTHACLANLVLWQIEDSFIKNPVRTLQMSAFAFDASIHEIAYTHCAGGALVCIKDDIRKNFEYLHKTIYTKNIELLWIPISLLNGVYEEYPNFLEGCKTIRFIVATGEQLKMSQNLQNFLIQNPTVGIYNFYGPSETHVVTSHLIRQDLDNIQPIPPIGKPIRNSPILILDKWGQLSPVGVVGEMYLGGANVALGYWNLPDKTKDKFCPLFRVVRSLDGIPEEYTQEIFYKSGDLGSWQPDGTIQFLGRSDEQIKIRGNRVEPIEIESVLMTHPKVRQAVVIPIEQQGQKQLLAYYVLHSTVESKELSDFLRSKLPDYMIPALWMEILDIPLNSNGKVAKSLLPIPQFQSKESKRSPENNLEQNLLEIWQELLSLMDISTEDHFFEIGGNSISAMRLVAKIKKQIGVRIGLQDLFHYPTIHALGQLISSFVSSSFPIFNIQPLVSQPFYDLSYAQKNIWVQEKIAKDKKMYWMVSEFELNGKFDIDFLIEAIRLMVNRHEILRTYLVEIEGLPYQKIVSIEDFCQIPTSMWIKKGEISKTLDRVDLDIGQIPLFSFLVEKITDTQWQIAFITHHWIADGISNLLFWRELSTYYLQLYQKSPIQPTQLPIQYKDCVAWLNEQTKTLAFEQTKQLWKAKWTGFEWTDFPTDLEKTLETDSRGIPVTISISTEQYARIKQLCQTNTFTTAQFLVGVLGILLARYTGREQVCIGFPLNGRPYEDFENQLGVWINVLPLKMTIRQGVTFTLLTEEIKQAILWGLQYQQFPFELLLELPSNQLPYQWVFNYLEENEFYIHHTDLKIRKLANRFLNNKYPIEWHCEESDTELKLLLLGQAYLFYETTLQKIGKDFEELLKKILSEPIISIQELKGDEIQNLPKNFWSKEEDWEF